MHFGEVSSSATPPPWPCPAPGSLSPTQPGVPTQSPAQRPGPPLPRWPAVRSSPAPLGILSSPAGRLRGGTHVNEPTAARWSPQRSHPDFPLNNTSQLLSHSFRTGRPVSFGRTGHFPTFPDPGVARWQQTETRRAEPCRARTAPRTATRSARALHPGPLLPAGTAVPRALPPRPAPGSPRAAPGGKGNPRRGTAQEAKRSTRQAAPGMRSPCSAAARGSPGSTGSSSSSGSARGKPPPPRAVSMAPPTPRAPRRRRAPTAAPRPAPPTSSQPPPRGRGLGSVTANGERGAGRAAFTLKPTDGTAVRRAVRGAGTGRERLKVPRRAAGFLASVPRAGIVV